MSDDIHPDFILDFAREHGVPPSQVWHVPGDYGLAEGEARVEALRKKAEPAPQAPPPAKARRGRRKL